MAYFIARSGDRARNILLMLVILPFWSSFLLRVYAWIGFLKNNGVIDNTLEALGVQHLIDALNAALGPLGWAIPPLPWTMLYTDFGVYIGIVYTYLPFMILPLYTNLVKLDGALLEASADLGAKPFRTFLSVTLPLSMPGVVAGVTTAFAWTFSAFATPQLIGGGRVNMVSNLVYQLGFSSFNFPFAASLCVAGLALTIVVLAALRLVARPLENIRAH
jgi:ABC-type spermidine/putrescine transport system permease subunit I